MDAYFISVLSFVPSDSKQKLDYGGTSSTVVLLCLFVFDPKISTWGTSTHSTTVYQHKWRVYKKRIPFYKENYICNF